MTWPLALVLCVVAIAIAGAYCFRRYAEIEVSRQHTQRTLSNNVRAASERMARMLSDSREIFAGVTKSDNLSPLSPERAVSLAGENVVEFGKRKSDDNKPGGDAA